MHQDENKGTEAASVLDYWTKYVKDYWNMPGLSGAREKRREDDDNIADIQKKYFESIFSAFGDPGNMEGMFKGMNEVPRINMEMGQKAWELYSDFYPSGVNRIFKGNERVKDLFFSDVDQNILNIFGKIYEKEFRKFLEVPQLGLNRFKQERINRYVDRFNLFQKAMGEFIHIFYVPMEKAACAMREKMEEMFESGEKIEDAKEFHALWIRLLEEQYMAQLESSEYTEALSRILDATVQFRAAKEEVLFDILQTLPIPTNKDMDELYKDVYNLKKSVRKLSAEVSENLNKTHKEQRK